MNFPASKRALDAHPTKSRRCSGFMPAKNGCVVRTFLRSSMAILPFWGRRFGFANGAHFLSDINSHRTPSDAAAATHAAGAAELVEPSGELMSHPLTIARAWRGANAAAVNVGKVGGETGVPLAPALGVLARQVGHVLHAGAET